MATTLAIPISSIEILSSEQPASMNPLNPIHQRIQIAHGPYCPHWRDHRFESRLHDRRCNGQFEPSELVEHVPELLNIANLDVHKIGNMFSEDIRPNHWNQIIDASSERLLMVVWCRCHARNRYAPHHASAVAFAWCGKGGNPPGRIAFVGSQRSSDRASSDAAQNLISAVKWAAEGRNQRESSATRSLFHAHNERRWGLLNPCSYRRSQTSLKPARCFSPRQYHASCNSPYRQFRRQPQSRTSL